MSSKMDWDNAQRVRARMYERARTNPEKYQPLEWTVPEIRDIIKNGRCAVTGIKFLDTDERGSPFQASPDRLDCSKGYTKENTRWVCYWINNALNIWGDDILYKFVRYVYEGSDFRHRNGWSETYEGLGGGDQGYPHEGGLHTKEPNP